MGNNKSAPTDYSWSFTDEPHASRRKEILKKYPQIKELFGYDSNIKYICLWWVITQLFLCWILREASWGSIILIAYVYGGFAFLKIVLGKHYF